MYRPTLFVSLVLLFTSCQQEFTDQEDKFDLGGDITSDLAPYFKSFQEEAEHRGILVDYTSANVTAEIKQIDEGSVAGTCTTNGHDLRHISIDQSFWSKASPLLREMVIFHELGHCILGRGHEEGRFDNGVCRSIMRSGLGTCADAYNVTNRDYFIEELFDVQE